MRARSLLFAGAAVVALATLAYADQSGMMMGGGNMMTGPGTMMGPGGRMNSDPGLAPMMGDMPMMMGMMGMMDGGDFGQHVEGRLAFLKTELAITAAQEPLWQAYETTVQQVSHQMQSHHDAMMSLLSEDKMPHTLPEQIALQSDMLTQRAAAFGALKDALLPLYGSLSAEQKSNADRLMLGPMMGMM